MKIKVEIGDCKREKDKIIIPVSMDKDEFARFEMTYKEASDLYFSIGSALMDFDAEDVF